MIIKDHKKKSFLLPIIKILAGLIIATAIYFLIPKDTGPKLGKHTYHCDYEHVEGDRFVNNNHYFSNAKTQTDKKSRSGKHSSLINFTNQYSGGYTLEDVEKGDQVCLDIWRYSPIANYGFLAIQGNEGSDFAMQTSVAEETDEDGWDRLNLCFDIPDNSALSQIKLFAYSTDENGYAYFDDLTIRVIKANEIKELVASFKAPSVELYIDSKGWKELDEARKEAQRYGILVNNRGYINANFTENKKTQDVSLRLKGDWHDHLEGGRWSFRIKTEKDDSWNRMQAFSLQSPERRFFAKEWLFHDFLDKQDVLSPKYDFLWLKINDRRPMVYAYEEHFDKHLPESQSRREGVIVKFTEDAAWEQRLRSKKALGHHNGYLVEAKYHSDIAPFKESRIEGDSNQMKQFIEAQELMYAYKYYLKPVDEIFDIDRMAKYYASLEVLNAYHSLVWHNQRFYYNPVTHLLEPIAYDGYIEESEYKINTYVCFGYYKSFKEVDEWSRYYNALFRNEAFAKKYAHYLNTFSQPGFMREYFDGISDELNKREELIKVDFPKYRFDQKAVIAKAKEINASLPLYNNISLKAYREERMGDSLLLSVSNFNHLPIEIVGTSQGPTDNMQSINAQRKIIWSNHPKKAPEYASLKIGSDDTYIIYRVLGLEELFHSKIKKWPSGQQVMAHSNITQETMIPLNPSDYTLTESDLIIETGNYTLTSPLIISDDINVIVRAGTTIDLQKRAFIFSYGSVQLNGTADQPIRIHSSDHTGQGLVVMKAGKKSIVKNTLFEHLDNFEKGNWIMPGAVTFYESHVDIYKSSFIKNHCEDALNIVRSDFLIDRMHIADTYADGFDADFCSGKITNSHTTATGNDGFDFSGSVISMVDCTFKDIGDKGLSAGEQTTIEVENVIIDGADIGIASKDLSEVTVKSVTIKNAVKAFAAYQKKPEYGPAKIVIHQHQSSDNKFLDVAEKGSTIKFLEAQ